ncbi:MAG: TGS domain-containing protein [Deltaproteobacteria bacterium]|nr:TGS domain-containing protein [Deltaproteobacteria bacterium]MBN2844801.1 TGS domain-containing protein [Deltaproteobacteria bacterium]
MPANLPPQYLEAEKRYREASTPDSKVEALEEMLAVIPKHKGTDKLRAALRRRLSKHKDQSQKKKGSSRHKTAFSIDKEGAAQVVVIGPPNTGKSSLIATLTKASPEVAEFPHTTHKPTPGMAPYENIQFQLVDTPPITKDYVDPLMADLIRRADIVVILVDISDDPIGQFEDTFYILETFRIFPEGLPVPDNLTKTPFIKKMVVVANKMDDEKDEEDFETFLELTDIKVPAIGISIERGKHCTEFLGMLYDLSRVIRVYTKSPGKEPDLEEPFVIPRESTLEDLAEKIHKDFVVKLRYARIWGTAVRDGQMVQRDYIMQDGDVVELHT